MNPTPALLKLFVRRILVLLGMLAALVPSVKADLGSDWLAAKIQADGSLAASDDLATPYQSTAETLLLWQAVGETYRPEIPAARQFLEQETYHGTEYLSKLILVKKGAGYDITNLVDELLPHANPDGGFGELPGYDSTALDTAFALQALRSFGNGKLDKAYYAIGYLLAQQRLDGGWETGANTSSVYVAAQAIIALAPYANTLLEVPPALTAAQNFLLSKHEAVSLWGEDFLSAAALLALLSNAQDGGATLQADIDVLRSRQTVDGSWSGDVYSTALALQVLIFANNPVANPSQSALQGRVLDGDSGLALAGVQISLQGAATTQTVSDADGYFLLNALPPGSYSVTLSFADYSTLVATTSLAAGNITSLGTLNLLPATAAPSAPAKAHT